jgi:hypothetical protein
VQPAAATLHTVGVADGGAWLFLVPAVWFACCLQVCYSLICTLSMPTWVLHGSYLDCKEIFRKVVLGSGIFIGIWIRCDSKEAVQLA